MIRESEDLKKESEKAQAERKEAELILQQQQDKNLQLEQKLDCHEQEVRQLEEKRADLQFNLEGKNEYIAQLQQLINS